MVIVCLIVALICVGLFIFATVNNQRLEKRAAAADAEAERLRQYYESETIRIQNETQLALANAQALLDQQLEEAKQEFERVRQHYQSEAHKSQVASEVLVAKTLKELEPLRRYASLREPEAEAQRLLAEALAEATGLREDARALLEKARTAAVEERAKALQKAKELRQQAEALLAQATRDAGRMVSDAEKRAEQIGGDAYAALRDKQTLEQAVQALWNATEGYGDRYVIPTRSMLDELAADFGYT
ncbi:MAG: hypothetical protein NT154_19690 [Verrucomicrobia bacterium]|nr:hypothetical protein [Verrucomicrobiota bacterium]